LRRSMIDRRALYVGDPQQLGAAWLPVRAQRAHGEVWVCPLARVAGGRTSPVGTSSLAKRFPTD
jgi:hypothetical protein